ncbi:ZPR1 zinc-finger domain-containing protein [Spironucleus salmonicida]|uniref:ZPR1 zinc-finger domain-containing protein n=1 Tax=Spironucleus salmonicida TaxID=348837 RepID=V6LGQ2_9EUKA|nr:ZPR1 zinc-finger domain-containing protein [Spironucleus salmonicida]|eukprot:EST43682.1 ZPR1 zinc-finger domain-containing protein [Spironucleus salmonicida]
MSDQESSSSSSSGSFGIPEGIQDLDFGRSHTTKSLCTSCGQQGITRLLFVDIPKFREIIVSSFKCKNCGLFGRDVQQASEIQDRSVEITLPVKCSKDLSRGIVKSSFCLTMIPELGFEIAARPMSGVYTTLEGLLKQVVDNLGLLQAERRQHDSVYAAQIDDFIERLNQLLAKTAIQEIPSQEPLFTIKFTDPSGNSHVEPFEDLPYTEKFIYRTNEQAKEIGLTKIQEKQIQQEAKSIKIDPIKLDDITILCDQNDVVAELPIDCPNCEKKIFNRSVIINIPYFKQCLLQAASCDDCSYRSVEISSAGAISPVGRRTTFKVTDATDLSRDVLKSDTCSIEIPELGLELQPGTLGGVYTTLEGLMTMLKDELTKHSMYWVGDAYRDPSQQNNFNELVYKLNDCVDGKMKFTIIIDDPLDGSFIKNIYAPDPDPEMQVVTYERTHEQNEEFGFNDIDVGED